MVRDVERKTEVLVMLSIYYKNELLTLFLTPTAPTSLRLGRNAGVEQWKNHKKIIQHISLAH